MSFTYERKIDAMGGDAGCDDFLKGYNAALTTCSEIGADADQVIAELMETLDDILTHRRLALRVWADDAETLLRRIRARQA